MTRYVPILSSDRRKKIVPPHGPESIRVATLGVFMILLAFFVTLVAGSQPDQDKSADLIGTLRSTFKPLSDTPQTLSAPLEVPRWLAKNSEDANQPSAMEQMRALFPDALSSATDNWGTLELTFTQDRFQSLILTQNALAQNLFQGLSTPLPAERDDSVFMLEVTLGTDGMTPQQAKDLLQKISSDLRSFNVHPSRLVMGYEKAKDRVVLRMTPVTRYEGIL